MNNLRSRLFALAPALVAGLLVSLAPAQQVGEASAKKAAAEIAAAAEKAWQAQDWKTSSDAYAKLVKLSPENGTAWHRLGYALHADGRLDDALQAHIKASELPGVAGVGAYNAACVYALQGDKDKAFAWLEKSRQKGFNDPDQLEIDTDLDSLRDDPRFKKFADSLGEAIAPAAQVYVQTTARQSSRVSFWTQSGSIGQLSVDHGQPTWKSDYAKAVDSAEFVGKRWRLGNDFWTTFDTNLDLRFGDAEVPAGAYYLTIEKKADGSFVLAFNDPKVIRSQKLDAFQAHMSKGGIEVEMMHETSDEIADKLMIGLKSKEGDIAHGAMAIRFGPHTLKVPFEVKFDS